MASAPGVWGVDLGLCALKAIRLEKTPEGVKATAFDYIEHPKILSQPDADPDQLTRDAIQQFLSRNQIRYDQVCISVPGQSGLARFVKLPPVAENRIADIVKFEAKQQIPFPLDEVVWDFQKIGTPMMVDGLALETEIGLFAMKKDMVNRSLQAFTDSNVECHVVQMAPLALVNYVAYDLLGKNPRTGAEEGEDAGGHACVVALEVGTDNSNLVITDGEKIIWQRPIPLGGNHFTRALSKDMKLTFAKAEHLKRNAVKSPDLKTILASLKSVLNDFVGEIQRSLGYFTNTHRDANIQYMVGLGGAFRLPGLQKFLQEKLQLEVRKISRFERLGGGDVLSAPQFTENLLSFATPYGLALQGLKLARLQTNLLPYEVRVERMVRGKKPWAAAAAASLLVAIAGLSYGKSLEKAGVENKDIQAAATRAKDAKTRIATSEADKKKAEEALKVSGDNLERLVAGVKERLNWHLLEHYVNISLPHPPGGKLTELSSTQVKVRERYATPEAYRAFQLLELRRTPNKHDKNKIDPTQAFKDEEFIKKHIVQISVEGIHALYCDDVPNFFKNVIGQTDLLKGMEVNEKILLKRIASEKGELPDDLKKELADKNVPSKSWVVEIRGFTYHHDAEQFVMNTLIENLRLPGKVNPELVVDARGKVTPLKKGDPPPRFAPESFHETVLKRRSFLFLYKSETIHNPEPGQFTHIKSSHLPSLLSKALAAPGAGGEGQPVAPQPEAGGAPKLDRSTWRPIGEIASAAHGAGGAGGLGGPGGPRPPFMPVPIPKGAGVGPGLDPNAKKDFGDKQPRTEFVVLFLWNEPLPIVTAPTDVAAPASVPTPNAPPVPPPAAKRG